MLREARGRLIGNQFLHGAVWALLAGGSAFVGARTFFPGCGWKAAGLFLGLPLGAALVAAVVRWRSPLAVAREVDARAGTRDRLTTELALTAETPWSGAVHREVAVYFADFRLGERLRLRGPGWRLAWLLIPALAIFGLESWRGWRLSDLRDEQRTAGEMLRRARDAAGNEPGLEAAAKGLDKALEALPDSQEPLREALRALADLERRLADAPAALTAAETAALARALEAEAPGAASQLQRGDPQGAAEGIAKLDPAALARALDEAARHLASRRLEELARDRRASQQLGALLRTASGTDGETRKKFLSALRDIRTGTEGDQNSSGEGQGRESPGGGKKPESGLAENAPPGGEAGSDRDTGRGSDRAGPGERLGKTEGPEEFVEGQRGAGASMIEILRGAGEDDPTARRAWKAVYQSAAPAALDAVAREDIPAGSRLLVKRYFEAIRPKE